MAQENKVGRTFVPYAELKNHGIPFTRIHLNRLIERGLFPAPVELSPNRIAWDSNTLEGWKASRQSRARAVKTDDAA